MGYHNDEDDDPTLEELLNDVVQPDNAQDSGRYAERNRRAEQLLRKRGYSDAEISRLSLLPEKPGGNQ